MKKKYVFFGAGEDGRRLINIIDKDRVHAFIDNDKKKIGTTIQDIFVYDSSYLLQIKDDFDIVLSISEKYQHEIENQLKDMGIYKYMYPSELLREEYINSDERIRTIKNSFTGKRCFIIGTGPSLSVEDLNTLEEHQEISFASNKIFKIFEQTLWRPQLYCVSDVDVLAYYYEKICNMNVPYQFIVNMSNTLYNDLDRSLLEGENKYVFNIFYEKEIDVLTGEKKPVFSVSPDKYIVDGGITVTYSMLQWAYFLGFKEVYLLGIDFDYGDITGNDCNKKDHFCESYIEQGEKVNSPKMYDSLNAYRVAKSFADNNDFKIYNATRGGKLEVFDRVDFDGLFKV